MRTAQPEKGIALASFRSSLGSGFLRTGKPVTGQISLQDAIKAVKEAGLDYRVAKP
jgi:hypothetical protein